MTSSLPWFRFYDEALDDPKIQRMPPALFRYWVNVLCLANRGSPRGALPPIEDVAFALRIDEETAGKLMAELRRRGLIDDVDGAATPHNWGSRQFKGDNASQRVKAYRERISQVGGTTYLAHRDDVMERDGGTCVYCGATEKLCIDHLIPVLRGGDNEPDNLVVACKSCNSGKAGRLIEETVYTFRDPHYDEQYRLVTARLSRLVTVTSPQVVTVREQNRTEIEQSRAEAEAARAAAADAPPAATPPKSESRKARLAKDWAPTEEERAYAAEHGLDPDAVAEAFYGYWRGKGDARLDWHLVYLTWVRREAERPGPQMRSKREQPAPELDEAPDPAAVAEMDARRERLREERKREGAARLAAVNAWLDDQARELGMPRHMVAGHFKIDEPLLARVELGIARDWRFEWNPYLDAASAASAEQRGEEKHDASQAA
jgi:5-methylcytosine-specific restriction endonuclease McrA